MELLINVLVLRTKRRTTTANTKQLLCGETMTLGSFPLKVEEAEPTPKRTVLQKQELGVGNKYE